MANTEPTIEIKVQLDEQQLYEKVQAFLLSLADDMQTAGHRAADDAHDIDCFYKGVVFAADWLRAVARGKDEL